MKNIETVLFVGAGAVGAMVASTCFENNASAVRILAGGERLERYRKNGIHINGKRIPFEFTDVAEKSEPDLLIIACKYHHLPQIMDDIKNHVGKDTIILSLLNGIDSEKIIGDRYGHERLPLSFIIATDAQRVDSEISFANKGKIVFGAPQNNASQLNEREKSIAAFFEKSGVAYEIPENMLQKQWFKFMMNVSINQISAIGRATYEFFQRANGKAKHPNMFDLMVDTMQEVVAIANAEGVLLTQDDIDVLCDILDSLDPNGRTSMCQDVLAKRKTEVEMFAPVVCKLGKRHGINTPHNDMFFALLKAIEVYS